MKSIAVFWSNRSEEHLLAPVIEELRNDFDVQEMKVPDETVEAIAYLTSLDRELPDYAIVPYDRPVMAAMALICYHVGVPIIQLHAGDISSGTFDDVDRWCITAWADYHFCAGKEQAKRVRRFLRTMGKEPVQVKISGVTNLDDIDKMSEPPDGDYDIVLYNPPTKFPERIGTEIAAIFNMINRETYWIEPNGDAGSQMIESLVKDLSKNKPDILWTETMPHENLLGLMSRAKRVIGNSSALFFEAPYFNCQVVQVGERNSVRETVLLKPGGAKRIAKQLRVWLR